MALPSSFRQQLGDACYLFPGADGCVNVRSIESFNDEATELIDRVKRGEASRDLQRAFAASATEAAIDKQGRVTITPELRSFAGIEPQSPIRVLGSLDHIEIWTPPRYDGSVGRGGDELSGAGS